MFKVHQVRSLTQKKAKKLFLHSIAVHRGILSEAYLCERTWQERFKSPYFRNIKMAQYFIEIDKKFGTKRSASGFDIDLFANCVKEESQLDELEHLLYKFRRTKQSTEIMDSTIYAIVRAFLKMRQYDSLLRILQDTENYGIFPDLFSYNIMMDTFLEEKLYKEAAQSAVLMMLQEDFKNQLSIALGLYSSQMFLNNCSFESSKAETEDTNKEEDDEDNVTYKRVPFLRNYWFDDHFNITNKKHLIGKTLYLLGREKGNILGRSYQLIGLALYEKWDKTALLLQSFTKNQDSNVISESIEKLEQEINSIPDDENNTREKTSNKFKKLVEDLKTKGNIIEGNFMNYLDACLKESLKFEEEDIKAQQQLFSDWEIQRKAAHEKQNKELDKEKRLKDIEEKKEYILWKEKLLFFFENEHKILEEHKNAEEIIAKIKACASVDDTYVPPEYLSKPLEKMSKYKKLARVRKL